MRMFPNADMLQMPSVPPAQTARHGAACFAGRTYQTAMDAMYGSKRPHDSKAAGNNVDCVHASSVCVRHSPCGMDDPRPAAAFVLPFEKFPVAHSDSFTARKRFDDWLERQEFEEVRIPEGVPSLSHGQLSRRGVMQSGQINVGDIR